MSQSDKPTDSPPTSESDQDSNQDPTPQTTQRVGRPRPGFQTQAINSLAGGWKTLELDTQDVKDAAQAKKPASEPLMAHAPRKPGLQTQAIQALSSGWSTVELPELDIDEVRRQQAEAAAMVEEPVAPSAVEQAPLPAPVEAPLPAPAQAPLPAPVDVPLPAPAQVPLPAPAQVPLPAPVDVPLPAPAARSIEPDPDEADFVLDIDPVASEQPEPTAKSASKVPSVEDSLANLEMTMGAMVSDAPPTAAAPAQPAVEQATASAQIRKPRRSTRKVKAAQPTTGPRHHPQELSAALLDKGPTEVLEAISGWDLFAILGAKPSDDTQALTQAYVQQVSRINGAFANRRGDQQKATQEILAILVQSYEILGSKLKRQFYATSAVEGRYQTYREHLHAAPQQRLASRSSEEAFPSSLSNADIRPARQVIRKRRQLANRARRVNVNADFSQNTNEIDASAVQAALEKAKAAQLAKAKAAAAQQANESRGAAAATAIGRTATTKRRFSSRAAAAAASGQNPAGAGNTPSDPSESGRGFKVGNSRVAAVAAAARRKPEQEGTSKANQSGRFRVGGSKVAAIPKAERPASDAANQSGRFRVGGSQVAAIPKAKREAVANQSGRFRVGGSRMAALPKNTPPDQPQPQHNPDQSGARVFGAQAEQESEIVFSTAQEAAANREKAIQETIASRPDAPVDEPKKAAPTTSRSTGKHAKKERSPDKKKKKKKKNKAFAGAEWREEGDPFKGPLAFGVGSMGRGIGHALAGFGICFAACYAMVAFMGMGAGELALSSDETMIMARAGILTLIPMALIFGLRRESPARLGWMPNMVALLPALAAAVIMGQLGGLVGRFDVSAEASIGALIAMVAIRALGETMLFQGLITRTLLIESEQPAVALVVSSLCFALYTLTYAPFQALAPGALLYVMFFYGCGMGFPFAIIYWRTRSLLVAFLCQFAMYGIIAWASLDHAMKYG